MFKTELGFWKKIDKKKKKEKKIFIFPKSQSTLCCLGKAG